MCHIRYSVALSEDQWIVRRDCRRLGAFTDLKEASRVALEAAAIDRVRGHSVDIMKLDEDGRWAPFESWVRHLAPMV